MNRKSDKVTQQIFTLSSQMAPNEWIQRFNFHAASESDATSKAKRWARYHSFSTDDVKAETPDGYSAQFQIHDEWMTA